MLKSSIPPLPYGRDSFLPSSPYGIGEGGIGEGSKAEIKGD